MPEFREAKKDCKILVQKEVKIKNESNWPEYFKWFAEKALKFREVANELLK